MSIVSKCTKYYCCFFQFFLPHSIPRGCDNVILKFVCPVSNIKSQLLLVECVKYCRRSNRTRRVFCWHFSSNNSRAPLWNLGLFAQHEWAFFIDTVCVPKCMKCEALEKKQSNALKYCFSCNSNWIGGRSVLSSRVGLYGYIQYMGAFVLVASSKLEIWGAWNKWRYLFFLLHLLRLQCKL